MGKHILITGGAGFIGSHLADALLARGHRVRALDNLSPQVHGPEAMRPAYLDPEVELQIGDVRDAEAVRRALVGIDQVVHFAAAVGVGQSMYRIVDYTDVNVIGTARLLEALVERPVERLLVASSMSIYGEGRVLGSDGFLDPPERTPEQLARGQWEPLGPDGAPARPVATAEDKQPTLASTYALNKYDQERLCLMVGRAYNIPTAALRFFNVFGTRQALSNPYTGVLAIFSGCALNGRPPMVFEDGRQLRDFVSVHDVAEACALALESGGADGQAVNVGSGQAVSIREVAETVLTALGRTDLEPEITGKYRVGDIRHCFADVTLAKRLLGFEPRVTLREGVGEVAEWVRTQTADDRLDVMRRELVARGLAR